MIRLLGTGRALTKPAIYKPGEIKRENERFNRLSANLARVLAASGKRTSFLLSDHYGVLKAKPAPYFNRVVIAKPDGSNLLTMYGLKGYDGVRLAPETELTPEALVYELTFEDRLTVVILTGDRDNACLIFEHAGLALANGSTPEEIIDLLFERLGSMPSPLSAFQGRKLIERQRDFRITGGTNAESETTSGQIGFRNSIASVHLLRNLPGNPGPIRKRAG